MRIDRFFRVCLVCFLLANFSSVRAAVKLFAPSGYRPSVPFLVRVEVWQQDNSRDWNLWDAEATLSTDQPGVTLSTNRVNLKNGLGTVLLTISGANNFNLRAEVAGESATQAVRNRSGESVRDAGGILAGTSTDWSGIIRVRSTVTVPAGHALSIAPDTLVLVDGTNTGTAGVGFVVRGSIRSLGTPDAPVVITSGDANLNWGQFRHETSQPSLYQNTFISRAGRAPTEGHTGTSPAFRTDNSTIDFDGSVISDLYAGPTAIGKIMMSSGSDITFRNCVLTRARMGPEIASTSLLFTNSYILEMRGPDDSDGIYLHNSGGRPLMLSHSVIAGGDDDAIDTLDSNATVEYCILRDWPNPNEDAKGISGFNGEIIIRHCLFANCFAGVSTKSSGPLAILRLDHCTIVALDRGVAAATKANASAGNINIFLTNSIVIANEAIYSDFGPEKFTSIRYCLLSEPWTGPGVLTGDPLFVNSRAGNYQLQPGSPAIDAGDPSSPADANGSPTDIGFFTGLAQSGSFVRISAPSEGSVFLGPTNITLSAVATVAGAALQRVEFFEGTTKLGQDLDSPYTFIWTNVSAGLYSVSATAVTENGIFLSSAPVAFSVIPAVAIPTTNILVRAGSEWSYLDDGTDQGNAWRAPAFGEAGWKRGLAEFGYGDGDEVTVVSFGPSSSQKYPTTYFRHSFVLEDPARVQTLNLNLLRDDGAIVYLNGLEAYRISMPPGEVNFRTYATTASEYNWEQSTISPALLRSGTNVIAVEVHQGNAGSSDLSFDLALNAVFAAPTNYPPMVALTHPKTNILVTVPASLTLSANAIDADGTVTLVSFFANGIKLGEDGSAPYEWPWPAIVAGEYLLQAVAVDNFGLARTSAPVRLTVSANNEPPMLSNYTPSAGRVTNLTELSVTFSKVVRGVDASDLLLNGVPAKAVSGAGSNYVFQFNPQPHGVLRVRWSELSGIEDNFSPPQPFNSQGAGATWQYENVDTIPPFLAKMSPLPGSTLQNLTSVTVTFSEPVLGLNASDLLINNIPAAGVAGSGAGPYTFQFTSPAKGTVRLSWATAHGITDLGGNSFGPGSSFYVLNPDQPQVTINEIMYHSLSEDPREEFIEVLNRGPLTVNLQGWRLSRAVDFTFPDVNLASGGYLVIAADLAIFQIKNPGVSNVVGNWTGTLSNSRETINLEDAKGNIADAVRYADEGDWANRQRGRLDIGHRGWRWKAEHDGLGSSAERINPLTAVNNGQNWFSSRFPGGTPGRPNSVLAERAAPFILNATHFPAIPTSQDQVILSARVINENDLHPLVTLHFRADALLPGAFTEVAMRDDGTGGDAFAGDGIFSAALSPRTNNSVVEFFIQAADTDGRTRFWPAPTISAEDGTGPAGHEANVLYQVDDSIYEGTQPLYKIIMTERERLELQNIDNNITGAAQSDAQMNATFISQDATGTDVKYLVGIRNRGHGTRTAKPNNFRVNFRSDNEWKGVLALNLNSQYSWLQVLGSALNLKSGIAGAYSSAVQLRVNNQNLVFTGGLERTYGSYAANEAIDADWADRHFPNDGGGNIYRAIRDLNPSDFDYRTLEKYPTLYGPEDKNSYTNTWSKASNVSEDNWTDLIVMLRVFGLSGTTPFTRDNLSAVINIDQWLRHLALMNLLGNAETGLNSGYNDDYFMYRGQDDPRFILMYYDLDTILGPGGSFDPSSSLFSATSAGGTRGAGAALDRFLHHPEFEPLYYSQLKQLIESSLSQPEFDSLVEQTLDFVPENTRTQLKNWMAARRTYVLSQLPPGTGTRPPVATISGVPRSPSPLSTATLQVSGNGVTHYRFQLNNGTFSPVLPVATPISLDALADGLQNLTVVGLSGSAPLPSNTIPTSVSWVVNKSWPSVRLNEIAASLSGNLPDFIELLNDGSSPLNLAGLRLTDNSAQPSRFIFPAEMLMPGNYRVVTASELGFSLSANGEAVYLFNSVNAGGTLPVLLDSVAFGNQLTGYSIGRLGGDGSWQLMRPSPGLLNAATPLGSPQFIKINEWSAFGVSPHPDDFVELFNPQPLPAPLGGLYLSNEPIGAPRRSQIRANTFIGAGGYLAFKSGNGNAPNEITFNLSAEQGQIALLTSPSEILDNIVYGPQQPGISNGRCPDGAATVKALAAPSPGAPNLCLTTDPAQQGNPSAVVINELLANNSTWTEADGSKPDWIELFNPSTNAVILSGLSLSDSLSNPERWLFPATAQIAPRGFLKVRLDSDAPASSTNAGFALKNNGGAVFLFKQSETGPTLQSSLTYGLQAPDWSIGRVPDGDGKWVLTIPTFGGANTAATLGNPRLLKVNEWMAEPASGEDWFEIFNPNPEPVEISGLALSDNFALPLKQLMPPLSFMGNGTGGFHLFVADNDPSAGADHVNFRLNSTGEAVLISTANGTIIDGVSFGPQLRGVSQGCLLDGTSTIISFSTSSSPGTSNFLPLEDVVINELLSHSDLPLEDAVELFNPTASPVDISGWYLSDSPHDLRKYLIPAGTLIPAQGYLVLYENQFNNEFSRFSFSSSKGDEVYLSQASNGVLSGYRSSASFGPSETGISFGRVQTSQGYDFVPLSRRSFGRDNPASVEEFRLGRGAVNAGPKVGPVVISEIMYHPVADEGLEFVELQNMTSQPVSLYDPGHPANTWHLRKGINFDFPSGLIIPPGEFLVLVNFDPTADPASLARFRSAYATNVTVLGPYAGRLDNSGEMISLQKPDQPETTENGIFAPYVVVDQVQYGVTTPWPATAAGTGLSVHRFNSEAYANDPLNWFVAAPTPGQAGPPLVNLDSDHDGMPDSYELAHGFDPGNPADANQDADGDGLTNLQEFWAGTDPRSAADSIRIDSVERVGSNVSLRFKVIAGQSYSVLVANNLTDGWIRLTDVPAAPATGAQVILDGNSSGRSRFYRLVSPALP